MPSDFISLFSGDLDLNSPGSVYSKGKHSSSTLFVLLETFFIYYFSVSTYVTNLPVLRRNMCACGLAFTSMPSICKPPPVTCLRMSRSKVLALLRSLHGYPLRFFSLMVMFSAG
ncbi:hypothetical protein AMECASPLE_017289 [Ameca splendens]|uniref:Uncharacterized protein n=1 Tax=Ameca splendens TaxID=208324 RepID=A0ABV0YDH2_9TELE